MTAREIPCLSFAPNWAVYPEISTHLGTFIALISIRFTSVFLATSAAVFHTFISQIHTMSLL